MKCTSVQTKSSNLNLLEYADEDEVLNLTTKSKGKRVIEVVVVSLPLKVKLTPNISGIKNI